MKLAILLTVLVPLATTQLGAPTEVSIGPNDPSVQFAVGAINAYHTKLGDTNTRTLVKVVKATSQVVAGTLYHFELQLTTGSNVETCTVEVWSRPWLSGSEATQTTGDPKCKPETTARQTVLVGGQMDIDANTPEVQNALSFAVMTMNAQENYLFLRKPIKITKVTSQVVSGISYHFYGVHMAATTCGKNGPQNLANCPVSANNADTRVCDFNVWWQSWMTPEYQLTNVKCQ